MEKIEEVKWNGRRNTKLW